MESQAPPPFRARPRILMGPGPSMVHPSVYEALGRGLVGHLDPQFLTLMDETQAMLRRLFRTENRLTVAISGTGSAGMEAALANVVEPEDEVLVCVNGVFGGRMAEIAKRQGGVVHRLERPWGEVFDPDEIRRAMDEHPKVAVLTVVHAETSTGARQPLDLLGRFCRERDCLLVVDAVTSLGGMDLRVDDWEIDVCYSGTQKCLSCPPGLAPLTFGPRAMKKLQGRSTPVRSWYLDLSLIARYWAEGSRSYHHTAPISMNYALHQALTLVLEEGLPARFRRHRRHSEALLAGLGALRFEPLPREGTRLPMLNAVRLPEGLDEGKVRGALLEEYDLEIGGGLGELAGKVWRIGLMGESSRRQNVLLFLAALEELLGREGRLERSGAGLEAAAEVYRREGVGG